MFMHQLGREIWTNMWSAHFVLGHPVHTCVYLYIDHMNPCNLDYILEPCNNLRVRGRGRREHTQGRRVEGGVLLLYH